MDILLSFNRNAHAICLTFNSDNSNFFSFFFFSFFMHGHFEIPRINETFQYQALDIFSAVPSVVVSFSLFHTSFNLKQARIATYTHRPHQPGGKKKESRQKCVSRSVRHRGMDSIEHTCPHSVENFRIPEKEKIRLSKPDEALVNHTRHVSIYSSS